MSSIESDDSADEGELGKVPTQQMDDISEKTDPSVKGDIVANDDCEVTGENTDKSASSAVDYLPSKSGSGIPSELLGAFHNPNIDEDTPAGEALRANAEVQVRRSAKFARKIHVNSVRQIVKKATRRGIGNRRGKPPRLPPHLADDDDGSYLEMGEGGDFGPLEEIDEDSGSSSSNDEDHEEGVSVEEKEKLINSSVENETVEISHDTEHFSTDVLETGKKCKSRSMIFREDWNMYDDHKLNIFISCHQYYKSLIRMIFYLTNSGKGEEDVIRNMTVENLM